MRNTPTDTATEIFDLTELREATESATKPFWRRISALLFGCTLTAGTLAVTVAAVLVANPADATGRNALIVLAAALSLAFIATIGAGLRDYHDARSKASEQRLQALIQCETYRLEKAHLDTQQEIARQFAQLQGQIVELLGRLPDAVSAYGDGREDEGEDRAVRRLAVANGRQIGAVPHLRSVGPN